DRLDTGHTLDVGDVGGVHDRQDLREARVHARAVERRTSARAGGRQNLGLRRAVAAMIGVAVASGDPVGGGDDVDAGLQHLHIEVDVGPNTVERQAIRAGGQDLVDGAGRGDADGTDAGDLADIASDLVR